MAEKMKYFILCTIWMFVYSTASRVPSSMDFEEFKRQHGKTYKDNAEEEYRKNIFLNKLDEIQRHNEKYAKGEVTYTMGVNQFTDLLPHEISMGLFPLNATENVESKLTFYYDSSIPHEEEVNWSKKGAVTPVKDQRHCGSCWAFSATGAVEGAWFLKKGKLASVSEQNLVDCSGQFGNDGCSGGWPSQAMDYIIQNKGIDTEDSYPYEGKDDKCRYSESKPRVTISSYGKVDKESESALQQAVATKGPISVAIEVYDSFLTYHTGVYYEPNCSNQLNHGVLVVGYGHDQESGMDYWLVKNSWSSSWGDQGYIKMARNKNNNCGIASVAVYPVV